MLTRVLSKRLAHGAVALFVLLVVSPWSVAAAEYTFTKIADTNTPVSGGTGTFERFGILQRLDFVVTLQRKSMRTQVIAQVVTARQLAYPLEKSLFERLRRRGKNEFHDDIFISRYRWQQRQ